MNFLHEDNLRVCKSSVRYKYELQMILRLTLLSALFVAGLRLNAQDKVSVSLRDSILHAPKMQCRLNKDSTDHSLSYYFRINHVSVQIESRDDETKEKQDTTYLNIWGAPTTVISRFGKRLMFRRTYEYDEFGNQTVLRWEEFQGSELVNVCVDRFYYNIVRDGMNELVSRFVRRDSSFNSGRLEKIDSTVIDYTYDEMNKLISATETGTHSECPDGFQIYIRTVRYAYSKDGQLVKRETFEGGSCKGSTMFTTELDYDADGNLSKESETAGGTETNWSNYTWTSDRKLSSYFSADNRAVTTYQVRHTYSKNGLPLYDEIESDGEKHVVNYEYVF